MKRTKAPYYDSFFVFINPFLPTTEWDSVALAAQRYFRVFLSKFNYGEKVISTRFDFFIEPKVDLNRQADSVSTSTHLGITKGTRLCVHIDSSSFEKLNENERVKLLLNGILYLLKYWTDFLRVPEGTPLEQMVADFTSTLANDGLFETSDRYKEIIIKAINPTRFSFIRHKIESISESELLFDESDLEKEINNRLFNIDYGKTIESIYFSYDIVHSDISDLINKDIVFKFGRYQQMVITKQFLSKQFIGKSIQEQQLVLATGILESLDAMAQKSPSRVDFNYSLYRKGLLDVFASVTKSHLT